jgi:uncharacterized protein (TIGR03437 family)
MSVPGAFNSMTTLSDGGVLVVGGSSDNGPPLQSAELYDPVTGTWTRAADLTKARRFQSATLLQNGKVVVAGGDDGTSGVQKGFASSELFGASVPAQGRITNFSAASLLDNGAVAAESLASAFGSDLASDTQTVRGSALPLTLAGISITVQDSAGMARPAPLMAVSKGQINYQVPSGTAPGTATVTIHSVTASQNGAAVASGNVLIAPVAPGVFSADGSGQGLAAAVVLRIKGDGTYSYDQIAQFDSTQQRFVAVPIDLGPPTDQVFLVLLGTGIRSRSELSSISATIGAATVGAAFAGPWPQFPGVDQVNLLLPRALAGSGEVEVSLSVDGLAANTVNVNIR